MDSGCRISALKLLADEPLGMVERLALPDFRLRARNGATSKKTEGYTFARVLRRSLAVVPPHTPSSSASAIAMARHYSRTPQRAQSARARVV